MVGGRSPATTGPPTVIDTNRSLPPSYAPTDLVGRHRGRVRASDQVRAIVIDDLAALRAAAMPTARRSSSSPATAATPTSRTCSRAGSAQVGEAEAALSTARPGHSEHQLGTAVDILDPGVGELTAAFATTPAGQLGRRPRPRVRLRHQLSRGRDRRTCYEFEPWHLRYVGRENAAADRRIRPAAPGMDARPRQRGCLSRIPSPRDPPLHLSCRRHRRPRRCSRPPPPAPRSPTTRPSRPRGPTSRRPPPATTRRPRRTTRTRRSATIEWDDCGGAECAELEVPLDYDDPGGDTITAQRARGFPPPATASAPCSSTRADRAAPPPTSPSRWRCSSRRRSPSASTSSASTPGASAPASIDCGGDMERAVRRRLTRSTRPRTPTHCSAVSQDYVDGCESAAGDVLAHLGTENVARDIDAVRRGNGRRAAQLPRATATAPPSARRWPSCSPTASGPWSSTGWSTSARPASRAPTRRRPASRSRSQAYADDCDADDSCPIGPDAIAAIEELTGPGGGGAYPRPSPRDLGPGELSTGLALPLYSEELWPDLSDAVADALDGDGTGMVALADEYIGVGRLRRVLRGQLPRLRVAGGSGGAAGRRQGRRRPSRPTSPRPSSTTTCGAPCGPSTRCRSPRSPPPARRRSSSCRPPTTRRRLTRPASAPPSAWSRGVLLTYEGDGHTVVGNGVECVDDAAAAYLVDLEPPEDG